MEISLLNSLFHMSSLVNIDSELVHKYYQKTEDILELLKPILNGILNSEIAFDALFQWAFARLGDAVDELRKLLDTWQLLSSRVDFVLQAETLILKVRNCSLEIVEQLVASDQRLPAETSLISLQHCAQKMKSIDCELLSTSITSAIRDHVEDSVYLSDSLKSIANCLCLKSNQEFLIELVAIEKLKENAAQAEKDEEVDYIEHIIAVITRLHDSFVMMKISEMYSSLLPIPADFLCPLSLELMMDPVIVASGETYERVFIQKWIDLGLTVCPKTRKTLSHKFIPNNTMKELTSHWLKSKNMKLLDPMESSEDYFSRTAFYDPSSDVGMMSLKSSEDGMANLEDRSLNSLSCHSMQLSMNGVSSTYGSFRTTPSRTTYASPASTRYLGSPCYSISSSVMQREASSPYHTRLSSEESYPGTALHGLKWDFERMSLKSFEGDLANTEDRSMNLLHYHPMRLSMNSLSSTVKNFLWGHNLTTSASPDSSLSLGSTRSSLVSYSAIQGDIYSLSNGPFVGIAGDGLGVDVGRMSLQSSEDWLANSTDRSVDSVSHLPYSLLSDDQGNLRLTRTTPACSLM